MFRVDTTEKDGREVPIEDDAGRRLEIGRQGDHRVRPRQEADDRTQAAAGDAGQGHRRRPLAVLVRLDRQFAQQRYFIRIVTPRDVQDQIWLEAFPRRQQDAANFHHAQLIITNKMEPYALKLIQPNAKDYIVYQFLRHRHQRPDADVPRRSLPRQQAVRLAVDRRGAGQRPGPPPAERRPALSAGNGRRSDLGARVSGEGRSGDGSICPCLRRAAFAPRPLSRDGFIGRIDDATHLLARRSSAADRVLLLGPDGKRKMPPPFKSDGRRAEERRSPAWPAGSSGTRA